MTFTFCGVELPNPFFLARMAGLTDRSFRAIALELGAGLVFTEMVSAVLAVFIEGRGSDNL